MQLTHDTQQKTVKEIVEDKSSTTFSIFSDGLSSEMEKKLTAEKQAQEREAKARQAQAEAEKKAEDDKLAKLKEWQKFLTDHGYTEETKNDFIIRKSDTVYEILLFKKVGTFAGTRGKDL